MFVQKLVTAGAALVGLATAYPSTSLRGSFNLAFLLPSPPNQLSNSCANIAAARAGPCSGNTASSRSDWCDHSVNTDYWTEAPNTGVTREYWLDLTDTVVAPDGVSRTAMAVNGSVPGPTLFADWGDTVKVHVTNSMTTSRNGTSIHFHGIRQNFTNQNDGVTSITQCPTSPGETITYEWRALQYGSTWYHSHFALQAWQGIVGGIVINGPATANYDEDLGLLFLSDWSHKTVDELWMAAQTAGPPKMDNGLINGTNTFDQGGFRFNTTFKSGTSYRLRLVNTAIDTHFKFMIDNHKMTVIAADLVPIEPFETTYLNIGIAQRYDVIIHADQGATANSFWMRAIPQSACSENGKEDDIRGIIHYDGATSEPATSAYKYMDSCDDETDKLVPHVRKTVGPGADMASNLPAAATINSDNLFRWTLNSTSMTVDWANPTLKQIADGNRAFERDDAVIQLPKANEWVYIVISTTMAVTHPIHLHGHDFFIIAQGTGAYTSSTPLNLNNPPRRDTAMLPGAGHLVLAFETDNPGAWLMHCHIGWHTSEGFAMQFVERYDEIMAITDADKLQKSCALWEGHVDKYEIELEDSGV